MKKMKKFLSMLLAVVMVLAMAAPSFAAEELAENLKISIDNPVDGHSYLVYQIFTGRVSSEVIGENENEQTILTLSDVIWGDGVNGSDLLVALKDSTEFGDRNPFATYDNGAGVKTAADVAKVLSDAAVFGDNSSNSQAFAKIVGDNLISTSISATLTKGNSEATVKAGYYMIKDTKEGDINSVISSFILKVVNDTAATLKVANAPTPEKTATDDNKSAIKEEIGKPITFTLKATLPTDNFADYNTYKLEFVDTLSAGLTYINNGTEAINGINELTVNNQTIALPKDGVSATYVENQDKTHTLKVSITDVKALGAKGGSVITVKYDAKLNGNAIIHGEGVNGATNTNDLKLNYSNNPNENGTGTTVPDPDDKTKVTIDTFKITVDKIDGDTANESEPTKLMGAEFMLYKEVEGTRQYAVIDPTTKEVTWTNNKDNGTKSSTTIKSSTTNADEYAQVVFSGLTAGTYWVEEVKAPVGYNLAAAKEVTILDTDSATNMDITVEDFAGTILPSTGGIGTTIFYAVGIILMAGAVFFVVRRKRA